MIPVLFVLAVAALSSLTLTPLVRNFARRRGWMDLPDGRRKNHAEPVPRLGGVGVYAAFVFAAAMPLLAGPAPPWDSPDVLPAFGHLVLACGAVLLIGVFDDIAGVSPLAKLSVQTAAAAYLYFNGYRVDTLSNPFGGESVSLGWLALPLTLLWFVGMSNAFNLIDGLDGLAAGVGFFSTTTIFIAAVVNERWEVVLLSSALGGALLGFLRYNFNPASIFLGDSGSLLVGFALAGFAIRGSMKSSAAIAVVAPLLALALPLLDAGIAVLRRVISGQNVFEADFDHIHHRLLRRGLTPRRVVLILYGAAALFGALSLLTMTSRGQVIGLVVIASSVVTWIGIQQLGYSEFGEVQRVLRQGIFSERHAIPTNLYLRSVREAFEKSRGLRELREALAELPARLGFWRLELLFAVTGGQPEPWVLTGSTPAEESSVTLAIRLAHKGQDLGLIRLIGPVAQPEYQLSYLLEALQEGLAPRLAELLAPPDAALQSHVPRRQDATGTVRSSTETGLR